MSYSKLLYEAQVIFTQADILKISFEISSEQTDAAKVVSTECK